MLASRPYLPQAAYQPLLAIVRPCASSRNVLARSTAHYRAPIGDASALIMNLVSRDLDRATAPLHQAAEEQAERSQ